MSVASLLTDIDNVKTDIATAIEGKGVTVGAAPFTDYPSLIDDIETGGGSDCDMTQPTWAANAGYPDLPAIFAASSMTNKRYIVMFRAGSDTWTALSLGGESSGGSVTYETSDGASYTTDAITHNWNTASDIDTGLGFKVRWLIVGKSSSTSLSVAGTTSGSFQHIPMIWVYVKSGAFNQQTGNSTYTSANRHLECLEYVSPATLAGGTYSSTMSNLDKLECFRANWASNVTTWSAAFDGCYQLYEMAIPNTVTTLGTGSGFNQCRKLKINIPTSLTTLNGNALFSNCWTMCALDLSTVTTNNITNGIGASIGIKSATITPPMISATNGFSNCQLLKDVTFTGSFSGQLQDAFFNSCIAIEEIEIPSGITTIGDSCFNGCNGLKTVVIPSSVTTIEDSVFAGCQALTELNLPSGLTTLGNNFVTMGVKHVEIPSGVTRISTMSICPSVKYLGNMTTTASSTSLNYDRLNFVSFALLDVAITLSSTVNLSKGNLISLIACLKDNSGGGPARTLTLGGTYTGRLSAGEIAVATAKNWTLA